MSWNFRAGVPFNSETVAQFNANNTAGYNMGQPLPSKGKGKGKGF